MLVRASCIITALIIGGYPAFAEITPDNCYDYLESGEANYNIAVSTGNIEWDIDTKITETKINELEKRLSVDPDDTDSLIELFVVYNQIDRGEEATKLAGENVQVFEENNLTRGDEASAAAYTKVVLTAKKDDLYDKAYLTLLPFLESGEAEKETFETAIALRTATNDYELAAKIADAYIAVYPEEASAHYLKFSAISTSNIYGIVGYWLQKSVGVFLEGRGETAINESNVGPFVKGYIKQISGAFEIHSVEMAVELDPDNYEYNLAAAIFKTLIVYYSAIGSVAISEDLDESSLLDLFRTSDPEGLADILPYLERAESARPNADVQVYLAYTLYYMSFGDFDNARDYANLAVNTRPDMPETYDALILISVLPIAVEISEDPAKAAEVFPELLEDKINNTGGDAQDFAVLAAVEFFQYPDTEPDSRKERLSQMKRYIDSALAKDANNFTALLGLGNYYILKGDYEQAIDLLTDAFTAGGQDNKALFLNNRGIAKILSGDEDSGVTDLKKALEISDGNERTTEALTALGID